MKILRLLTVILLAVILSMCCVTMTIAQPNLVYPITDRATYKTLASEGLAVLHVPQADQIKLIDVVPLDGPILSQDQKALQLPAGEAKHMLQTVLDAYAIRTGDSRYLGINDIQVAGALMPNTNPTNPNIYVPIEGRANGITSMSIAAGQMCNPVGSSEAHNTFHVRIVVPTDSDPIDADIIFLPGASPIDREPAIAMFVAPQQNQPVTAGGQQWY